MGLRIVLLPLKIAFTDMNSPKKRFVRRYQFQDFIFGFANRFLGIFFPHSSALPLKHAPKRILICNIGHLGDVVISTAFLGRVRTLFPLSSIDYLVGSYSKDAIQSFSGINKVYYIDHWYLSSDGQLIFRVFRYAKQMIALRREFRECNFDVAIDLRAWFPNCVFLMWFFCIPSRIGWDRLGLGSLLTHAHTFEYNRRHEIEHQIDLLNDWSESSGLPEQIRMMSPHISSEAQKNVELHLKGIQSYCVLHMTGSTQSREWDPLGWVAVAKNCLENGVIPVITGVGRRAAELSDVVLRDVPGVVCMVDKLEWSEYIALIAGAKYVVSIETSAGHIAAALKKPTISIYGGMADYRHWRPYGPGNFVLSAELECSPCFKKNGCLDMTCMRSIDSKNVIALINQILHS